MTKQGIFIAAACSLAVLAACATAPIKPQPSAAIAFQADVDGCRNVTVDLHQRNEAGEFFLVEKLAFNDTIFGGGEGTYHARNNDKVFVKEMVPGRYFVRNMTCNDKVPQAEATYGGFDVVAGRTTYIGSLELGRRDGRVILASEDRSEEALAELRTSYPAAADNFGILLMQSILTPR